MMRLSINSSAVSSSVLKRHLPFALTSLAILLIVIYARHVSADSTAFDLAFSGYSRNHPLGTDEFGRDCLSRLISGSITSIFIAVIVQSLASCVGIAFGCLSAYSPRLIDDGLMAFADAVYAFPSLLLIIVVASATRPGYVSVILSLSFVGWPGIARVVRVQIYTLRRKEFVVASYALGAGQLRLLLRHIIPNAADSLIALFVQGLAIIILTESALSYLGIGIPVGQPSLGAMIARGRDYLFVYPRLVVAPAFALVAMVVYLNRLGSALVPRK